MEEFYYEDTYHYDFDSLIGDLFSDDEEIYELEDDWFIEVTESKSEKVFEFTEDFLIDAIINVTDRYSDRFPENDNAFEDTIKEIKDALKQSIDIDKLNELTPSLLYNSGNKVKVTKQDLVEYIS